MPHQRLKKIASSMKRKPLLLLKIHHKEMIDESVLQNFKVTFELYEQDKKANTSSQRKFQKRKKIENQGKASQQKLLELYINSYSYYESDEVSSAVPGIKDCVTVIE